MGMLAQADVGRARGDQVVDVETHQILPVPLVKGHACNHPDPHAEPDVVLDHVGIGGGQHGFRREAVAAEGLVHLGATGKAEHIGDEGIAGQIRHRQRLTVDQRMTVGHHHAAPPAITGNGGQLVEQIHGLGGDRHIHIAALHHLGQLGWRPLMELDRHIGITTAELGDHRWQLVARLGVGGGDTQHPAGSQLLPQRQLVDLLHLCHHPLGQLHHLLACAGQADQILPLAGKEGESQLIFQHLHLLAEGGLGGVELLRRRRDVEVILHNLGKVLEPGDVHLDKGSRCCGQWG